MGRAAKVCSHIGPDGETCPHFVPCPEHTPKPWTGSMRRSRLRKRSGSRQQKLRRFVLRRDQGRCHVCGRTFPDDQLVNDHVVPVAEGGADTIENMAACCKECHAEKVQVEARRGRGR